MAVSFDSVFGNWSTENCVGTGTDGRVYLISRKNESGAVERSALKTIRIGDNRSESKGYNSIGEPDVQSDEDYFQNIIKNITENINTIKENDRGKRFVNYEEYEVRKTSDGKGRIILIRLEEMRSLTELLNKFSFTLEETINLGISVCKALIRCRDFGYIYPNLKPENILFDKKGICKLGDFGSFSCLEPSKTSVAYKRTQYYMAPEYIKTGKINCTCDTYALGLVLYMLTNRGRLPFTEKYPQNVTINGLDRSKENRINGLPLPKPELSGDALFEIIKKACAFDEKDRYLSPKQMLSDLKNALENKPFEKAEYEDIYSVSHENPDYEEPINNEPTDQENLKKDEVKNNKGNDNDFVSLKDEITIPDVLPGDYSNGKKTAKRKRTPTVVPITQSSENKKFSSVDIKKISVIIIAILCVVLLLFVSLKLRNSNSDEAATSFVAETETSAEVSSSGG
ncbi:MAG: protein kinase [Acutalibacteraceae bacterium]